MDISRMENLLTHLNYRWGLQTLALWEGRRLPFTPEGVYEGFESFLRLPTLTAINAMKTASPPAKHRVRHAFIDHYLQRILLPHQAEMQTWMRGAAAHVNGEKIYLSEVLPWCRKSRSLRDRRKMQSETGPLCKFLKPFAVNHWNVILETLTGDLGYAGYIDYCGQKKEIDYDRWYSRLSAALPETDGVYFDAMEAWCKERFGAPLSGLNRFDAVNLLGMSEFDPFYPPDSVGRQLSFFRTWGIDIEQLEGLHLAIDESAGKNAQAMCFILQAPEEVYILMRPEGGWIDLETLWHELGHGLSAVYTSETLSIAERDLSTSFALSEAYAFLLQNIVFSKPFLTARLLLSPAQSERLAERKRLKDLYIFRRYAAKFLAEYEMFQSGDIADGTRYAELMHRYTGFAHLPESHLFDLVPEFYSLDYVSALVAEAAFTERFIDTYGPEWMFHPDIGETLKALWRQGNRYSLTEFMVRNGFEEPAPESWSARRRRGIDPVGSKDDSL